MGVSLPRHLTTTSLSQHSFSLPLTALGLEHAKTQTLSSLPLALGEKKNLLVDQHQEYDLHNQVMK